MNESIPHTTEEPLSKAPNPELLHSAAANMISHYSVCVCSLLTAVCVHLDGEMQSIHSEYGTHIT